MELRIPYADGGVTELLRREAKIESLSYEEDGIAVTAVLEAELLGRLRGYIPDWEDEKEDWER